MGYDYSGVLRQPNKSAQEHKFSSTAKQTWAFIKRLMCKFMHRSVMKWEIIIMGGKGEFNLDEMEDGEIWINSSEQAGGENFCCSSELEHIKVDYKIRALFIFLLFFGFPHYLLCSCIYVFISKCQIMLQKVVNISEQFSRPSVTMAAWGDHLLWIGRKVFCSNYRSGVRSLCCNPGKKIPGWFCSSEHSIFITRLIKTLQSDEQNHLCL